MSQLGIEGLVRELAVNCILKERTNESVHLMLDAAHVHLRSDKLVQRLEEALQRYLGAPIVLSVDTGSQHASTPEQLATQRARERQRQAEQAIESDLNVRALQDAFGAQIIPNSVHPVE